VCGANLDNHATTPLDPRVLDAMMPFLLTKFGDAASRSHRFGWDAEKAVELARKQVADLIGATPREIVFTSGATESNNLALNGVMEANQSKGRHIITVTTEHKAVIDTVGHLERQGYEATLLMPRGDGGVPGILPALGRTAPAWARQTWTRRLRFRS
jgi:cysteine desulfurase